MKLNNSIRQAFVRAALDDVPSENYQEQITKLALQDAIDQLPALVTKAYKTNPEYFDTCGKYFNGVGYYGGPWGNNEMTPETVKQIKHLQALNKEQHEKHHALEITLRNVANSVTTRKALAEALPEFEKYLPEADAPLSRQVPALANVVSDFVKAGWPKGNKEKLEKAAAELAA